MNYFLFLFVHVMLMSCLLSVRLPAHFHDVTCDHIWSKILQGLTKSPVRSIFEEQATSTKEQATSNTAINKSNIQ